MEHFAPNNKKAESRGGGIFVVPQLRRTISQAFDNAPIPRPQRAVASPGRQAAGEGRNARQIMHWPFACLLGSLLLSAVGWAGVAGQESYTYDALGRLTSIASPDATNGTYTYDAAGNRLTINTGTLTPPGAPGPPTASSITGTTATISWTAASDRIGVAGYSYQLNGGAWSSFSNVLSANLTGLTYGSLYTVGVRAQDSFGNIGPTTAGSFSTLPSAPGAPTASSVTGTTATISWTAASDNIGVTGYSYQLNGQAWSSFSNVLSANLTGLAYGTLYTVGVRAQDSAGSIGSTATATGLFSTPPSAPGTPTATSVTGTTATVSWTAASDNVGVTGYRYQVNGGAWSSFNNVLSVNLTGLIYGTLYTVGVQAQDTAGNTGATATGSFTATPDPPPGAPGTPTATSVTGTTATVSWTAASDTIGIAGYSYQLNGGAWSSFSPVLSVNLTGLTNATAYSVGVRAQNVAGNVGPTATGSFTTVDTTPPGAPGAPTASNVTGTTLTVNWGAATDNVGVTGYSYQFNGGAWSGFSPVLSVNLTGLTQATTYSFGVRAQDAAGNVGPTATGSVSTLDTTPPSIPGGPPVASNIGSTTATETWHAATDNVAVVGYEYSLNGTTWTNIGNVLSVNLTGLTPLTFYNFNVRAYDAAGNRASYYNYPFNTISGVATLTIGTASSPPYYQWWGYRPGTMGSMSPTAINGTLTYTEVSISYFSGYPPYIPPSNSSTLSISGFTSDPTWSWLTSITVGGYANTTAYMTGYGYSAGTATWTFSTLFNFGPYGTTTAAVVLVH